MSAKWRRSKAWDDRFFPTWAWPAKFMLRAFSSIWLAVIFLSIVALYGILASVPIGLLALAPTYMIYALSLAAFALAPAMGGSWLLRRLLAKQSRAIRFSATFLLGLALALGGIVLWRELAWPHLHWDPVHGSGLRLFPEFVSAYDAVTIRRLPIFEMSELEFYSWWPLRVVLLLFVANMIIATVRRIEFIFPNLGVLMVHTGIVVLALGSMHYNLLKEEGDALLIASFDDVNQPGPMTTVFYDNTRIALFISQDVMSWEQRPLRNVPRYNDYGVPWSERTLDLPVPPSTIGYSSPDIQMRLVGYAHYTKLENDWIRAEPPTLRSRRNPLIEIELLSSLPDEDGDETERAVLRTRLPAASPQDRIALVEDAFAIEHVPASDDARWRALTAPFPEPGRHALMISATEEGDPEARTVKVVRPGDSFEHAGHRIEVQSLLPSAPFPIITPGYEGADSSVAILSITPPDGEPYERYVYHRFPALDQDVTGFQEDGRPNRRPADDALRIHYIDASILQVYLRADGRGAVRRSGGDLYTFDQTPVGESLAILPHIGLRVAERWEHAEQIERPTLVPERDRDRERIGTHAEAAAAVEISLPDGWSKTIWLPFAQYLDVAFEMERSVTLPDGREIALVFGRLRRPLPGIGLELVDFEMIPYAHSDIPRDYVSLVRVTDFESGEIYTQRTRLNAPLIHRVPFTWTRERPFLANLAGSLVTTVAPNQFKFSQAGWDIDGWRETEAMTRAGQADRPRASFTVLGVGNNPGIYIVAAGAVMACVGVPWAFYIKPLIVKRRKLRIQRMAIAAGGASTKASGDQSRAAIAQQRAHAEASS
ncbi:MAG: hypothetical protein EA376_01595 [Phycisphaeraceae bacterium]|nr:MAG: hypothetical protein EA376_01595 [Phycisphaeraceae bacterium]